MFNADTSQPCRHCGHIHGVKCPAVRAVEYFPDGAVKRVEYMTPADYMATVQPQPMPTGPITCGTWWPANTSGSHA